MGFSEAARSHVRCALAVDKLFYISWCGAITLGAMHSKYCHHRCCHQEHRDLLSPTNGRETEEDTRSSVTETS